MFWAAPHEPGDEPNRSSLKPQTILALGNKPSDFRQREKEAIELDVISQRFPPCGACGLSDNRFGCYQLARNAHPQQDLTKVRPGSSASF